MHDRTTRLLEQVFEEERKHLVAGDLLQLSQTAKRKDHLCATLAGVALSPEVQAHLSALAQRNQALLDAAREGLSAAITRLAEMQRGAPVGTYSRLGEKSEFAKPIRTLQRRV